MPTTKLALSILAITITTLIHGTNAGYIDIARTDNIDNAEQFHEQSDVVSDNAEPIELEVDDCGQDNTCERWYCEAEKQALTKEEYDWITRVMFCESTCRADVVNSLGYTGLMQWSPYYWNKQYPDDDIFDGRLQIQHSLEKYRQGGSGLWVCK